MPIQQPIPLKGSKQKEIELLISDFKQGVNSFLDEARLPKNALRAATNMMLTQDGVLTPRWGTRTYTTIEGTNVDGIGTFTKYEDGELVEYMIAVVDGVVKTSMNGGAWSAAAGTTLTTGHRASLLQVADRVYIANGFDRLAYYDIAEDEVFSFTALDAPAAPTLTRSGDLSAGSYAVYYRVTAVNEVGETIASNEQTTTVNVPRGQWRTTDTIEQYVDLDWADVPGAVRYNIYFSDQSNDECYIDSVSTSSYRDDAHTTPNVAVAYPEDDTTGGPVVAALASSDNRLWATGDPDHPYRVYWTGVGRNINAFSPYFGGGYIDINKGSGEIPVSVRSYRDGRGEPVNVVFTTTVSGDGSQYQLALTSITIGTTSFIVPQVARVVGSFGTSAAGSIVEAKNNLFFPSTKGFFTTGAKPDLLNVLSTDEVSLAIRPDVRGISNKFSRCIVGEYFDNRIFWSVPASNSETNSEIWILDLELKAWIRPWLIGVSHLFAYTPEDGRERLMGLKVEDNGEGGWQVIEISNSYINDDGVDFACSARTALLHFDKGHMSFARLQKLYMELLRMSGSLSITISGSTKNQAFSSLKALSIASALVVSGYSTEQFSEITYSDPVTVPNTFNYASTKKRMKIRKIVNNVQIDIASTGATYGIATFLIKATPKRVADPAAWKN